MSRGTIEKGVVVESENLTEQQKEIRGIWEAIHFVDKVSKNKKIAVDDELIVQIQSRVMGHFHPEVRGKYRSSDPEVTGAGFIPTHYKRVRQDMLEFGRELSQSTKNVGHSLNDTKDIISLASWAHYRLVRIHPFAEGNGRSARLLVDLIAKKGGMYYVTDWGDRLTYVDTLKKVDDTGNLNFFERYLAGRFAKRYEEVTDKIIKSRSISQDRVSVVLGDLLNRKQRLLSIAAGK